MEEKQEIVMQCRDCQKDYVITPGEQKFYEEKELNIPKRCAACRAARKAAAVNTKDAKQAEEDAFNEMLRKAFGAE